ncbi:PC-esterase domain-containing protein 1A-like [Ischnura elegans]|uniref:PC-esterase domain-containing protein 1A-like n=1 Tax=Ischnura elegans TaxID=197161 RepID=UPI001ED87D7F|nr:PC-esterase domain-containing protein 1A-like [Ischnura elegans]
MADIFTSSHVRNLLKGKFILILGDSNMRAVYRDVVWVLNNNKIVPESHLRRKLDFSYLGDRLIKQGELNRGRDYLEMREYLTDEFYVKFNFLTKCLTKEVEEMVEDFKKEKTRAPDVIIINSCLWDIARWGPDGVSKYKENMRKLFTLFKESLPVKTLVIFATTPPISQSCSAAFLVKQIEFMKHSLRFEVMEANLFVRQIVPTYGYDIVDLHYHLRMQIHRRCKDGVHWIPTAVRHITNLLLTHISLCWDVPLPGNFEGKLLDRMKEGVKNVKDIKENCTLPDFKVVKDPIMPPPPVPNRNKRSRYQARPKRVDLENTYTNLRHRNRDVVVLDSQYADNISQIDTYSSTSYDDRLIFGQINRDITEGIDFTTDDAYYDLPIQDYPVFGPYGDFESHVGAERHSRSYGRRSVYNGSGNPPYRNRYQRSYGKPY